MRNSLLNGYRVIYMPEHPKAMKSKNWLGYVYEHIVVAERDLGREIKPNEEVHHLDFDRTNNSSYNLIVLDASQHTKLHTFYRYHANSVPDSKESGENRINSANSKLDKTERCLKDGCNNVA